MQTPLPDSTLVRRACGATHLLLLLLFFLVPGGDATAWGPRGHELVNEHAVATLPPELRPFFEAHRSWLVANASLPDDWVKSDPSEQPHHFIDIERYARKFEQMPRTREEALAGVGKDYLHDSGDLIWWLPQVTGKVAKAMEARNLDEILRWAVAVAHYAGDVSQPLHTTENYDGQLTQQPGVHAKFETQTVNHLAGFLELQPQPARFLADPFNSIFAQIRRSYRRIPEVLKTDKQARNVDQTRGTTYSALMASKLRRLIREQFEAGATLIGSLWFTAWIQAGRPDLSGLQAAGKEARPGDDQ